MTDPVFRSASDVTTNGTPHPAPSVGGDAEEPTPYPQSLDDGATPSGMPSARDDEGGSVFEGTGSPSTDTGADPKMGQALELLRQAVTSLQQRTRKTTSAGIKSEMKALNESGFDEKILGFPTFRSFLLEAERRGAISLSPDPNGPDVIVAAPWQTELSSSENAPGSSRKIRQHVWRAFVDWDPQLRRLFDRAIQDIRLISREPGPQEALDTLSLRRRLAEAPEDFVDIDPISREQQLRWMIEFAESWNDTEPSRTVLLDALEDDKPLAAFARVVRTRPALADAWHAHLSKQVGTEISSWLAGHELTMDVEEDEAPKVTSKAAQGGRGGRSRAANIRRPNALDDVRAEILALLEQLPTEELMQIKVPVLYLFKR